MLDLNNLELKYLVELRDEKEFRLYFQTKEINITDEEILQLKALLNNCKEDNKLTLQQLNNIAGGFYFNCKQDSEVMSTGALKYFNSKGICKKELIHYALEGNLPCIYENYENEVHFKHISKLENDIMENLFFSAISDGGRESFDLIDAIHLIHAKRELEKQGKFGQVLQDAYNALVKDRRVMFFEANFLFMRHEFNQISQNIAINLADKFNQLTESIKKGNPTAKITLGMSALTLGFLVTYGVISTIDNKNKNK